MVSNQVKQNDNFIFNIYEYLLCAYIIFTPIINSSKIYLFGYGIHITIILLLVVFTILASMTLREKNSMFFSNFILVAFLIEYFYGIVEDRQMIIGVILAILSYIMFLRIPNKVSIIKIFFSYYVSAIIAMFYTLTLGVSGDTVSRTATSVDGSISLIVMIIILFGGDSDVKSLFYKVIKFAAFSSCIIIVAFGMSRARLTIMLVLFLIKATQKIIVLIKDGKVGINTIFWIPLIIAAIIIIPKLNIFQELTGEISLRFEDGFESLGRTEEINVGWRIFLQKPFSGIGFEEFKYIDYQNYNSPYYNHCMYVAILARGGILLGIPFLLCFASIIKKIIKRKNLFCYVLFLTFMTLGYGNAGLFNFTICGFMIPLAIVLKTRNDMPEKTVYVKQEDLQ